MSKKIIMKKQEQVDQLQLKNKNTFLISFFNYLKAHLQKKLN